MQVSSLVLQFRKIVETCIYSSDLEKMKDFYINILGLEFVSEEKDRYVFLKAGQSMLLIFNPNKTLANVNVDNGSNSTTQLPIHGAITPPSIIHFALEIEKQNYDNAKLMLKETNIKIERKLLGIKVQILSTFETLQEILLRSLLQVLGQ
jgi:glyoxalase/bleomycin resistance protein/dioxygenase superfamily protein